MKDVRIRSNPLDADEASAVRAVYILKVSPQRLLKLHLICIAVLVACSISTQLANKYLGIGLVGFFILNNEANLPTFFSVLMLLEASVLLFLFYVYEPVGKGSLRIYWMVLGILFAAMSVDEASQIHEKLVEPIRELMGLTGVFHFSWVLPAMFFVFLLGCFFIRFLVLLDRRAAKLFVLSGSIYIGGALGFEMVGGHFITTLGQESTAYVFSATLEETLEMIGIALFVYALVSLANAKGTYWAVVDTNR